MKRNSGLKSAGCSEDKDYQRNAARKNVRLWAKADINVCSAHVRFRGKADTATMPNSVLVLAAWCDCTNRKSCDRRHSRNFARDHHLQQILQGMEGTMFSWKAQECIQIFAVTLAVGTFLALAAVIPA